MFTSILRPGARLSISDSQKSMAISKVWERTSTNGAGRSAAGYDGLEKNNLELQLKIEHVPTHQDIKELSERITTLHGTLSELNGRLGGINRAVDLLNEYHLKPGGEGRQ